MLRLPSIARRAQSGAATAIAVTVNVHGWIVPRDGNFEEIELFSSHLCFMGSLRQSYRLFLPLTVRVLITCTCLASLFNF